MACNAACRDCAGGRARMAGALARRRHGGADGLADADFNDMGCQKAHGAGYGIFCTDYCLVVVGYGIFIHIAGGTSQCGNLYGLVAGSLAGLGFARQTVVIMAMLRSFLGLYMLLAAGSFAFAMLWQTILPPLSSGPENMVMHFYRNVVGQMDGRSCPSYPVCSLYATQAVARHGLLIGSWLAMDRIIHEHDDIQRGQWLTINGEERLYDPLRRNDFWIGVKE